MLVGEEKASYFNSNKTVTGIAQCYSYFIVHYSIVVDYSLLYGTL